MPSNIVPVSTWTSPLTGPANGDPVDGGAGGPAYDMGQKLANRVEVLKDLLGISIRSVQHLEATPATEATSNETLDNSGTYVNVASIGALSLPGALAGDLLIVGAHMKIKHTATGGAAGLGMQIARNGTLIPGARSERTSTGIGYEEWFHVVSVLALAAPVNPEVIRLQTFVAGVTAQWQGSWSLWSMLIGLNTF